MKQTLVVSLLVLAFLCWPLPTTAQNTMTMPDGTVMSTDTTTTTSPDGTTTTTTIAPSLAGGSSAYGIAGGYNITDNQGNCVTHNCWILTNTGNGNTGGQPANTVSFVKVSSGYDGYTLGLGAGGNLWSIPFSTSTSGKSIWSMQTQFGGPYYSVAVVKSGQFFVLYSNPSTCATGYAIRQYLNGTWSDIPGCAFDLSAASNGGLIVIGTDRGLYAYNGSGGWLSVPGPWTSVAAIDNADAYAVKGNLLYLVTFATGAVTAVAGSPTMSASSSAIVFSPDQRLYAVTSTSAFYVYDYSSSTTGTGTWIHLAGAPVMLGGNSYASLWAQNSAGQLFHYLGLALQHYTNTYGNYNCPVNGCPAGSIHTVKASGNFPHGIATTTYDSVAVAPATNVSVFHWDTSTSCDPIFGDPNNSECFAGSGTGQVVCSVMGGLFSAVLNLVFQGVQTETAYTKFLNKGLRSGGGCMNNGGGEVCTYTVSPICSNTTNPDFKYPGGPPPNAWIRDYYFAAWSSLAECSRVNWGSGHSTWTCLPIWPANLGTSVTSAAACTYNP